MSVTLKLFDFMLINEEFWKEERKTDKRVIFSIQL